MATRLYGREVGTAPVTPAVDAAWESSAAPFARKPCYPYTETDPLTTVAGFTSTAGQDRCHRQWVSPAMAPGNVFDTSVTYKAYAQVLESATNDNIRSLLGVRIVSEDGTTVRHTVLAVADYSTGTEFNTALRNKAFANGDAGTGSYTTVEGDRLVVEWGHSDAAGASISASSRWGSTGVGGVSDLTEDETSTSTTARPWFETSLNIVWAVDGFGPWVATPQSFDGSANLRTVIPETNFTANRDRVRVRIKAGTNSALVVTGVYFGQQAAAGDAYDFATTPTQITFSGAAGVTIPVGTGVWSDWVSFALDQTEGHILSLGASGGSWSGAAGTRLLTYYTLGAHASAGTVNVTGYTADTLGNVHWEAIEVDESPGVSGGGAVSVPVPSAASAGAVEVRGSTAATLPMAAVSSGGQVGVVGAGAVSVPKITLSAAAHRERTGDGAVSVPVPVGAAGGAVEVRGSSAVSVPMPVGAAGGSTGVSGSASLSVPMTAVAAAGAVAVLGSGAVSVPVPAASGAGGVAFPGLTGSAALSVPTPAVAASGSVTTPAPGTYYVDPAGSNSNDGTSTGTAWQTVSKVNGFSFLAGDTVLFKRGGVWRENLVPPRGSISFGAYGSGADPVISAGAVVTGWTDYGSGGATTIGPYTMSHSFNGDANLRFVLPQTDFSADRTRVRVKIQAGTTSALVVTGCFFGQQATTGDAYDFAAAPTRLTFSGGSNGVSIPTGTSVWSDWVDFALDQTKGHILSVGASGGSWSAASGTGHQTYFSLGASASAGTVNVTGYSSDSFGNVHFESLEADSGAATGVYQAALDLASAPEAVTVEGLHKQKATNLASIGAGQWWWESDVLYVHHAAGNPDTLGHVVEYPARLTAMEINGKGSLAFSDLHFQHGLHSAGAGSVRLHGNGATGITFTGCSFSRSAGRGMRLDNFGGSTFVEDVTFDDCEAFHNGGSGVDTTDPLVRDVTFSGGRYHHNGQTPQADAFAAGVKAGSGNQTGILCDGVEADLNGVDASGASVAGLAATSGAGIWYDTVGSGCVIRNCVSHHNRGADIAAENTVGTLIHHNLCYGPAPDGTGTGIYVSCSAGTSTANLVYHNTVYDKGYLYALVGLSGSPSAVTNNVFKNNIGWDWNNSAVVVVSGAEGVGTNNTFDDNLFGPEGAGYVEWGNGTLKSTKAAWLASTGADPSWVIETANPLFTNAAGLDFTLQSGSPAVDAGDVIAGINDGYLGLAPDYGAFESAWSSGSAGGGAVVVPKFTLSAAGSVAVAGSVGISVPKVTVAATGTKELSGSASVSVPQITLSATGTKELSGAVALSVPKLAVSASARAEVGGSAALSLPALSVAATAYRERTGDAAVSVPKPTVSSSGGAAGSGAVTLTLPALAVSAAGKVNLQGTFARSLPMLSVAGTAYRERTGAGAVSLPMQAVSSSAAVDVRGSLARALPMLSVAATGGATSTIGGSAALALPKLTVSGSGAVALTGSVSLSVPRLTLSSAGRADVQGSGSVSLPMPSLGGVSAADVAGGAGVTLPTLSVSAEGRVNVAGSGGLVLPMIVVAGVNVPPGAWDVRAVIEGGSRWYVAIEGGSRYTVVIEQAPLAVAIED